MDKSLVKTSEIQSGTRSAERMSSTLPGLEEKDLALLVPGARDHLENAVADYTQQLFSEAKGIEFLEHAGNGPPEIAAAHVEEAKWVLLRRARRKAKHSSAVVACRIGQVFSTTAIGIGASNFAQSWGAATCVISVLIGSLLLLVERELSREA